MQRTGPPVCCHGLRKFLCSSRCINRDGVLVSSWGLLVFRCMHDAHSCAHRLRLQSRVKGDDLGTAQGRQVLLQKVAFVNSIKSNCRPE